MSWRPTFMFGSSASDREMMEEVLELLATDSPNDDGNTAASSRSSSTATNHSSIDYHSTNGTCQDHRGRSEFLDWSEVATSPRCDCEEEEKDARHQVPGRSSTQAQRQRREAVLGVEQQMPSMLQVMPGREGISLQEQGARKSSWLARSRQHDAQVFSGTPGTTAAASPFVRPPPAARVPAAPPPRSISKPRESSRKKMRAAAATTTSHVLPSGQHVHVMNGAEFDELRRKLQMQTASRRYRKRKTEESRQQKMKIKELQSELSRLRELEKQSRVNKKRSGDSLEKELTLHEKDFSEQDPGCRQESSRLGNGGMWATPGSTDTTS